MEIIPKDETLRCKIFMPTLQACAYKNISEKLILRNRKVE